MVFMTSEEVRQRIVNEIKARGYDDHYIDKNEEREIVQIAIQLGVSVETTLAALRQVCDELHYVLESRVYQQIEEQMASRTSHDGFIDQYEFEQIYKSLLPILRGKKSDRDIKAMILTVMERTGNHRIKHGWFGNWYTRLKREVGMA